jgi:predicted AlkP superfamily phosphohydrolase/phosphomutase
MPKAKKMVIFGIDSISMKVLDQILERGYCPTIRRLIENGCYGQGRSFCPVETGTNWPVLSTGSSPSIHGCNMQMRLPGMPLNEKFRGFPSQLCKAEQIWNAARRGGKRSVIFDYPQSFPVNCEGAIHVGEDGRPGQSIRALFEMCGYKTAGPYKVDASDQPGMIKKITFAPATDWANLPAFEQTPLAAELPVVPWDQSQIKKSSSLYALLIPEPGKGFTSVAICAKKDYKTKLGVVRLGATGLDQWSEPLINDFETDKGTVRAATRAKLFALSPDGCNVHLYLHELYPLDGFAQPESIRQKLLAECGPYYPHTCRQQTINAGAADVWTFLEEAQITAEWYRKAMRVILGNEEWDLFIQKWHPPDFCYHLGAFMIDTRHPLYDPKRDREGWDLWGAVMNEGDAMLKTAIDLAGPDAIVAVMSDHGGKMVFPGSEGHAANQSVLKAAGLVATKPDGSVDWSRTKAWDSGHYVYVNLKGRDPEGIVEPGEEYEQVRQRIIEALLDAKDPHTGRHAANFVCRIEDASMVGIGGDRVGDVFVWSEEGPAEKGYTREEFERAHPGIELGTWEWPRHNSGAHRPDPFMIMAGPGFKKGYRRDTPTWINYFAPTLSTAWGIPVPKDADGGVIWDFLENS